MLGIFADVFRNATRMDAPTRAGTRHTHGDWRPPVHWREHLRETEIFENRRSTDHD
ncbi:hypothetical protein ACS3SW_07165 [Roseobacteraceae bacterium S113]